MTKAQRELKKNIESIHDESIMGSSTTALAVTVHPGAIPGTSTIENQNNNSYLDYISTCAFGGKTVYLEDIPFSATGDGSDTEGVIVNIGDSIMSKDYGTYPTEAVMEGLHNNVLYAPLRCGIRLQ